MTQSRLGLVALVLVIVAFLGGLFMGRSGRAETDKARTQAELQVDLNRARVAMLHGRLEIVSSNFGQASQQFDAARAPLEAARDRLNAANRSAEAGRIDAALVAASEAQKLALALNREADAKVAEALRLLDGIQ
ncbi:MAG: hypothetical protein M3R55_05485 [Acidobacteriota bacterium]|nr:hypothetical protein [Acidobacteriota bacterium]